MRKPVFAANWKMHLGPKEARAFVRSFLARHRRRTDRTVVLIPPAVSIATVAAALGRRRDVLVGVQNIHTEARGPFTGETSAPMARDAGARLALVGHSERRHVFGETDDETAAKLAAALAAGLTPVLCVGETITQREAGQAEATVLRQLRAGLGKVPAQTIRECLVAYEPVWAIGTGRNATPDDASAMHGVIRSELGTLCGSTRIAASIPILYGGSVTTANAGSLLAATGVDGLLVGGASLDPAGWSAITST